MLQLSAQKKIVAVESKIEFDSQADICLVNNQYFVLHDNNVPVDVFGFDPKTGSKHACVVDTAATYENYKTVGYLFHHQSSK